MQIFNTKYSSKKGSSSDNYIGTSLTNNQRIIPESEFFDAVDEAEVYNEERENCDKIRLIVTINPICSNVLFNRVTEVVRNTEEGQSSLNYETSSIDITEFYYKSNDDFTCKENYGAVALTRDTQLSRLSGMTYNCGIDIFNNHLLRNRSFKAVCYMYNPSIGRKNFNTIFDYLRDSNGDVVKDYVNNIETNVHLYRTDEVLNFIDCVDDTLIEENGWFGFTNANNPVTYDEDSKVLEINRVINNQPPCAFIDLCPERDLWYLTPKYNEYKKRYEKNWHYCLTYPSSSTKSEAQISFLRQKTNSLKVYYFDDTEKLGGLTVCKIVSVSKHGLAVDDVVNLYVSGQESAEDTVIYGLSVVKVDSDYIFYVKYSQQNWFDTNFVTWDGKTVPDENWEFGNNYVYNTEYPNTRVPVFVKNRKYMANLSLTSNEMSFKQVINGQEVEYYVRIFSKLPNWRFSKNKLNPYLTKKEREDFIKEGQEHDFESHLSKLAFAKNIYGDDISQIVFTDDIQINDLTDNLDRPLTDIYLTIIKNNAGYKEWYGKDSNTLNTTGDTIEFSHVFGKVSCAFKLCDESIFSDDYKNVTLINNRTNKNSHNGLPIDSTFHATKRNQQAVDNDEILCDDINFYGDLCLFSPSTFAEITIDDIWYRFNTAQRELTSSDASYLYFNNVVYDDLIADDYDSGGFNDSSDHPTQLKGSGQSHEGYIYKPHYRIPIKSFSRELQTQAAHTVGIIDISTERDGGGKDITTVVTDAESYIEPNERFLIHNKYRNEYYECKSTSDSHITNTKFKFELSDNTSIDKLFDGVEAYVVIKRQEIVPTHALLLKDNTYRYAWRDLYQNGFDKYSNEEVYPFTNGALYIEKYFRLYCQRQDKDEVTASLFDATEVTDVSPSKYEQIDKDNYVEDNDITCF